MQENGQDLLDDLLKQSKVKNLLLFYHKCHSLIGCTATIYSVVDSK